MGIGDICSIFGSKRDYLHICLCYHLGTFHVFAMQNPRNIIIYYIMYIVYTYLNLNRYRLPIKTGMLDYFH